jgi:hypothetical protein
MSLLSYAILHYIFIFYILYSEIFYKSRNVTRSRNFKVMPIVYKDPFKLQPEDGFTKAETLWLLCSFN